MICHRTILLLAAITTSTNALRRLKHNSLAPRDIGDSSCVPPECESHQEGLLSQQLAIINEQFMYFVDITLNNHPIRLLLDTGSGDMWVNDRKSTVDEESWTYPKASTSKTSCNPALIYSGEDLRQHTIDPFRNKYLDGTTIEGRGVKTSLDIGDQHMQERIGSFEIASQYLGIANESAQCTGILGVGYLDKETSEKGGSLLQNLRAKEIIQTEAYSLFPQNPGWGGTVHFGAIDRAKFYGNLTRLSLNPDSRERSRPMINITRITTHSGNQDDKKFDDFAADIPAVLDIGSVLTYLPTGDVEKLLDRFIDEFGPSTVLTQGRDIETLVVPCRWRTSLRYVDFTFTSVTIQLNSKQLVKRVPGADDACIFGIASTTHTEGQSILGYTFLRSAYAVFDLSNDEVHLAQYKNSSIVEIHDIDKDGVPYSTEKAANRDSSATVPSESNDDGSSKLEPPAITSTTSTDGDASPTNSATTDDVPTSTPDKGDSTTTTDGATLVGTWSALAIWGIAGAVAIMVQGRNH
jgi:hypothetical protein